MNTTWAKITENLKKNLDAGSFKVWVTPLRAEARGGELRILAPNEFMAAWVERHLAAPLREAAAPVLGIAPNEIIISASAAQGRDEAAEKPASSAEIVGQTLRQVELPIKQAPIRPVMEWRYSFDDFVTGPSNRTAFAAARDISESGELHTLFVKADPGLGKTHLSQAAGAAFAGSGARKVAYLTAEEFASRYVAACKSKDLEALKLSLCGHDALFLEDIHFFQNKTRMQEMLLGVIKNIEAKKGRIIFTSSFTPGEMRDIDPQLLSHFCSGVVTLMGKPDEEMRREILRRKARIFHQVNLPNEVCSILAHHFDSDIRQLESCLKTLCFKAKLLKCGLSPELAMEAVAQYGGAERGLDIDEIIRLVCKSYGIAEKQIKSRSRKKECVQGRNTIFYLARKHTAMSLEDIGNVFNRSHTTVLRNITAVERELARQSTLGRQIARTVDLIERQAHV